MLKACESDFLFQRCLSFRNSSSFWSLLHFPLSSVPPLLTVAIDFGDKQPSKSHRMLPEISAWWITSNCHLYLSEFVTAYWCLYQKAGCKTDINWDKWADQWRSKFVPYSRSNSHIQDMMQKTSFLLNFSLILNRLLFIFVFGELFHLMPLREVIGLTVEVAFPCHLQGYWLSDKLFEVWLTQHTLKPAIRILNIECSHI